MFKITSGFYIVICTQIVNICIIYKEILYMGIYIVKKTFFYGNEVGGALRGTRQGSVPKLFYNIERYPVQNLPLCVSIIF